MANRSSTTNYSSKIYELVFNLYNLLFVASLSAVVLKTESTAEAQQQTTNTPFNAWISTTENVWVFPFYERYYPTIALLRIGDQVTVTGCSDDNQCNIENNPWVQLRPFGVIRMRSLNRNFAERTREIDFFSMQSPDSYVWGKVKRVSSIRDTVNGNLYRRGDELVLRNNIVERDGQYFFERPNGMLIPRDNIELFNLSTFSGMKNIQFPDTFFGFVIRDYQNLVHRYDRLTNITNVNGRVSITDSGRVIPRTHVRLGHKRERPSSLPERSGTHRNYKWIHVDLSEQVLTAYDENDNLVFATLVSSGRGRNATRTGTFEIRRKIRWTEMRGGGSHPYHVEVVPYTMYFDDAIALHMAYWHDSFGTVRSHGCVNLSPQDAKYLYTEFTSNIRIPQGWIAVHPIAMEQVYPEYLDTTYVIVEE